MRDQLDNYFKIVKMAPSADHENINKARKLSIAKKVQLDEMLTKKLSNVGSEFYKIRDKSLRGVKVYKR